MLSVSIETNPGSRKHKHGSNFNSGNGNKLVDLLAKNNYLHVTFLTLLHEEFIFN